MNWNPRVAGDHTRRSKKSRSEVGHLYRVATGDLFTKEKGFKPLMVMLRRREIYHPVSNVADQASKTADVLGMLVMKLSQRDCTTRFPFDSHNLHLKSLCRLDRRMKTKIYTYLLKKVEQKGLNLDCTAVAKCYGKTHITIQYLKTLIEFRHATMIEFFSGPEIPNLNSSRLH